MAVIQRKHTPNSLPASINKPVVSTFGQKIHSVWEAFKKALAALCLFLGLTYLWRWMTTKAEIKPAPTPAIASKTAPKEIPLKTDSKTDVSTPVQTSPWKTAAKCVAAAGALALGAWYAVPAIASLFTATAAATTAAPASSAIATSLFAAPTCGLAPATCSLIPEIASSTALTAAATTQIPERTTSTFLKVAILAAAAGIGGLFATIFRSNPNAPQQAPDIEAPEPPLVPAPEAAPQPPPEAEAQAEPAPEPEAEVAPHAEPEPEPEAQAAPAPEAPAARVVNDRRFRQYPNGLLPPTRSKKAAEKEPPVYVYEPKKGKTQAKPQSQSSQQTEQDEPPADINRAQKLYDARKAAFAAERERVRLQVEQAKKMRAEKQNPPSSAYHAVVSPEQHGPAAAAPTLSQRNFPVPDQTLYPNGLPPIRFSRAQTELQITPVKDNWRKMGGNNDSSQVTRTENHQRKRTSQQAAKIWVGTFQRRMNSSPAKAHHWVKTQVQNGNPPSSPVPDGPLHIHQHHNDASPAPAPVQHQHNPGDESDDESRSAAPAAQIAPLASPARRSRGSFRDGIRNQRHFIQSLGKSTFPLAVTHQAMSRFVEQGVSLETEAALHNQHSASPQQSAPPSEASSRSSSPGDDNVPWLYQDEESRPFKEY